MPHEALELEVALELLSRGDGAAVLIVMARDHFEQQASQALALVAGDHVLEVVGSDGRDPEVAGDDMMQDSPLQFVLVHREADALGGDWQAPGIALRVTQTPVPCLFGLPPLGELTGVVEAARPLGGQLRHALSHVPRVVLD